MNREIRDLLEAVRDGGVSVEEAELRLKTAPFADIGYAKVDLHRALRQGVPEVVYGAGKTPEQIAGILGTMVQNGQRRVLVTRLDADAAEAVRKQAHGLEYFPEARIGLLGGFPEPDGLGTVVVATGGTSDLPVAEEAALTARTLGNAVLRLYDVGVAGLHRLLAHTEEIMSASVIVAVAGMEGALASVIGGLADCPVIAVPTSVGYGASLHGLSALLSMLNSCASGVAVVNIDNGFGAGFLASRVNHMERKTERPEPDGKYVEFLNRCLRATPADVRDDVFLNALAYWDGINTSLALQRGGPEPPCVSLEAVSAFSQQGGSA